MLERGAIKNSEGWCIIHMYILRTARNRVAHTYTYKLSHAQDVGVHMGKYACLCYTNIQTHKDYRLSTVTHLEHI